MSGKSCIWDYQMMLGVTFRRLHGRAGIDRMTALISNLVEGKNFVGDDIKIY